jgi:hypothetical protein
LAGHPCLIEENVSSVESDRFIGCSQALSLGSFSDRDLTEDFWLCGLKNSKHFWTWRLGPQFLEAFFPSNPDWSLGLQAQMLKFTLPVLTDRQSLFQICPNSWATPIKDINDSTFAQRKLGSTS